MKKIVFIVICVLIFSMISCKKEPQKDSPNEEKKIAVVYFSATKNTKKVAEYISKYYSADIFEIVPQVPYTSSDLNYNNKDSRVSQEHNDSTIRPEISKPIDISSYDYIFLGYPIWWGQAPNILYTFVEEQDFSNKIIIPFATSASSSLGSSAKMLSVNQEGKWEEGIRFSSSVSESIIKDWLEELNINDRENQ